MRPTTGLLLLLVVVTAAVIAGAGAICVPRDRDALLAFKRGITSDPMDLLASWHEEGHGDCCLWRGVKCSNRTGRVRKLDLRNVHVDAYGYADSNASMVGQISHSLLSIDRLAHLDLSWNFLNGSNGRIPEFLGSLKSLRYLNLSGVPFFGRVPPQLGNLSKLHYLDLSNSQGSHCLDLSNSQGSHCLDLSNSQGSTYSTDISWVATLPLLQYLDMSWVNLSTIVDWPHVVNMLPSLRVLQLLSCSLLLTNQSLPHINITKLERLDLCGNMFDHPVASSWFWNLKGLQYLYLSGTQLYGQVPDALAYMTSLQVLDLSSNSNMDMANTSLKNLCNLRILDLSSCDLHADIKEIIVRMPQCPSNKLQELHLTMNNITGIMPDWMPHLTSLIVLDISYNNLTGAIPIGVGQLTSLSSFQLSFNNLTGPVPSEISMLSNLTLLDLSGNTLNGEVTEEHFASLAKLKVLHLDGNSLRISVGPDWLPPFSLEIIGLSYCEVGPLFPAWLKFQVDITWVDLSNTCLIDRLPDWFTTTFSNVIILDITHNQISGELPRNMGSMSLDTFFLSSNQITGQIPPLPSNLTFLDISENLLSGNLPSSIAAPKLQSLVLSSNQITGHLPGSICKLESLDVLVLSNNLFKGQLPRCFQMKSITMLMLSNNSFSGHFPSFLQSCNQLTFLDLSRNNFYGRLPSWIEDLVELRFLRLNLNMFTGEIPVTITNLNHLHHLNLAGNGLSGAIPRDLSKFTAMTRKYSQDYTFYEYLFHAHEDFSSMVIKGRELNYGYDIFNLASIDLSLNHLTGGIPEEIACLHAMVNLNLSWNYLSEKISIKFGAMQSLESLDLSKNVLSGEIPSSLSELTYLSYLDLSDNNLTGRIPSGRQLDTLYMQKPSMYSGNNGLCGPPLKNSCSGNYILRQDDDQNMNEHGFNPMSFYFGLGLGLILGLWVVFYILLFKKAWRIVYFCLIDETYDRMYVFAVVTWKRWAREETTN